MGINQLPIVAPTTKGQIVVGTSGGPTTLNVGANNSSLTADSTQSTGLKWSAGTPVLSIYSFPNNTNANVYGESYFVIYRNGYWFTGTENGFLFYSSDAKNWTMWTTGWEGVRACVRLETNGTTFIIISNSGSAQVASASSLGGAFTNRTSTFGTNGANDVCWTAGSINLYHLAGDSGLLASSPDGITWTARTSNQTGNIFTIETNGTNTIILGSTQAVTTNASYSTNGTTWTTITIQPSAAARYPLITYESTTTRWYFWVSKSSAYSQLTANITSNWSLARSYSNWLNGVPIASNYANRLQNYNTLEVYDPVNLRWITMQQNYANANAAAFIALDPVNLFTPQSGSAPEYRTKKSLGIIATIPASFPDLSSQSAPSYGRYISWGYNNGIIVAAIAPSGLIFTNA